MITYLVICAIVFIALVGHAVWFDVKYGPNSSFGYHCFNPFVVSLIVLTSLPFINVMFVVGMIALILNNRKNECK